MLKVSDLARPEFMRFTSIPLISIRLQPVFKNQIENRRQFQLFRSERWFSTHRPALIHRANGTINIQRMNRKLVRSLAVLSWLLLFSVAAAAQKYSIHLDQREKAGSRYHLLASSSEAMTTEVIVAGQVVQTTSSGFALELSADVTIIETNTAGWATRKSFIVGHSKLVRGDTSAPVLPTGTVVVASLQNGTTLYQVDGKPVDDATARALKSVISLHASSVGTDYLFGTISPKKVGDSWKVNVEAVNKLLTEMEAKADNAQIEGSSTLEKVEGGHLTIRSSLYVNNALLPTPKGFAPESGEMHTEATGRYPIKRAANDWGEAKKIRIRMVDKGPLESGVIATIMTELKTASQFEITPIRGH